jgi:outer membrane biosynthesis protein TonB
MAETVNRLESLQFNRRETRRLALLLALSLALHLLVWGGYEAGKKFAVWRWMPQLAWLQPAPKIPPVQRSEPAFYINVTPEQATTEPPPDAKYYSSKNSRAANLDANRDANVPKLNGTQTDVPKTETVTKPDFNKLQPAPRPANSEPPQPTPTVAPGDLSLGKPQERPRTVQQALAQMQQHRLPGQEMKQDGGVQRHAITPSFDAKATLFGDYDAALVDAVQQYWDDELYKINYGGSQTGKVIVQFHLNYDGRISDVKILSTTVGQTMTLMCETAVLDPAPYAAWPKDMRQLIGQNYREMTFTFYYY